MPLVGSTAFPVAGDVFELTRALLNDADIPAIQIIASTGAVRASDGVTITTQTAHNLQVGNIIQVANVYDNSFNGTFQIDSVPTATTFTYPQTAADATSGNGTVSNIVQGDVYTDTVLLPFVNSAYRKVQARLLGAGSKTTTLEAELSIAAGTTIIDDSTSPQLPNDFLAPRVIQERITGQPYYGCPMKQVDILPSGPQQAYNYVWSWRDEAIVFPGSLNPMDLKFRYEKGTLNILADASSQLLIRGCLDSVAQYAAYLAAKSRGSTQTGAFKNDFEENIQELKNWQAHSRQYKPSRRQSYNRGSRYGYGYTNGGM